jgi:aspartate/methionine/tyrosine aminotransferase
MEIRTSNRLSGVGEYYFSQKLQQIDKLNKEGRDIISLGIGSPDQPPHPEVIEELQTASSKATAHGYQSYRGVPALRNAMSVWYKKYYQVELDAEKEILPLQGSKEGILHICMTYLNKGDKVLVPDPGYPTYKSAVLLAGGQLMTYKLLAKNNFQPDFDSLEKKDLKKVKLMFVNYPHMPTGQLPDKALFEKLVHFATKHQILLIHDNPYSFILNDSPMSLLSVPGAKEVALELNSLSKSLNMAGWRVGMLCGKAERVNEVLRFRSNMDSGMFLPLQLAAAKALSLSDQWYNELNQLYAKRREKVFELLKLLKCSFQKNQAGLFVWAKVGATAIARNAQHELGNGGVLSDEVLEAGRVFITPGGIFGDAGKPYVRVSLCASEEKIQLAIDRIKAYKKNKV